MLADIAVHLEGGGTEAERLQVQVQPELLSKTLFKKEVRKKGEGRE